MKKVKMVPTVYFLWNPSSNWLLGLGFNEFQVFVHNLRQITHKLCSRAHAEFHFWSKQGDSSQELINYKENGTMVLPAHIRLSSENDPQPTMWRLWLYISDRHTIDTGVNIASLLHWWLSLVYGSRAPGSSIKCSLISSSCVNRTATSFCFFVFVPKMSL